MPLPITRPSVTITIEDRYNTQKVGGAYDAKSVKTKQGDRMPVLSSDGVGAAILESEWTKAGFEIKTPIMISTFKDVPVTGDNSKELSMLLTGFTNKKYKP